MLSLLQDINDTRAQPVVPWTVSKLSSKAEHESPVVEGSDLHSLGLWHRKPDELPVILIAKELKTASTPPSFPRPVHPNQKLFAMMTFSLCGFINTGAANVWIIDSWKMVYTPSLSRGRNALETVR